jgi:hypothetical protein
MNDWSFWNSSSIALKAVDASPHTSYLFKFLKSYPRRQRSGERLSSIAGFEGPSIFGKSQKSPFTWKGAQYSRGFGPVNALPSIFFWASQQGAQRIPLRGHRLTGYLSWPCYLTAFWPRSAPSPINEPVTFWCIFD